MQPFVACPYPAAWATGGPGGRTGQQVSSLPPIVSAGEDDPRAAIHRATPLTVHYSVAMPPPKLL